MKVLNNWYSKLVVTVKWNCSFSERSAVCSCTVVIQGNISSPTSFILFINAFIVNLKSSGIGCHVNNQYFGCLLYADDIILLSLSVAGLQDMLNVCNDIASYLALDFISKKCHCITFSKNAASII